MLCTNVTTVSASHALVSRRGQQTCSCRDLPLSLFSDFFYWSRPSTDDFCFCDFQLSQLIKFCSLRIVLLFRFLLGSFISTYKRVSVGLCIPSFLCRLLHWFLLSIYRTPNFWTNGDNNIFVPPIFCDKKTCQLIESHRYMFTAPSPRGALVCLTPPNKAPSPPN